MEDMKTIKSLDKGYRYFTGAFFEEPPKGYNDIYDEKS
jgi:alcohol dehydrogenase (NADP+)